MPDLTEDDLPRYAPPRSAPARSMREDTIEHGGRPVIDLFVPKTEDDLPRYDASKAPPPPKRTISGGEAFGRGAIDSATFGTAPVISGLSAAGSTGEQLPMVGEFPGLEIVAQGAQRLTRGDEAARQRYEEERADMAARRAASFEQHPYATMGGELAGGVVTPGFGAMSAGTLPARVGAGVAAGAIGGGLYGGGSAVGEGGGAPEAFRGAATGAAFGAPTGGLLHGLLGPRIPGPATTPMQRAAQTAAEIVPGGGLPQGLTSPIPGVKEATSSLAGFPALGGTRISNRVREVQEAAGQRVGAIASEMTAGERGHDLADQAVRVGLASAVKRNKEVIDTFYDALHAKMPRETPIDIPALRTAVGNVITRRAAKRETNPEAGLDQVLNAIRHPEPISFEGARGLRQDVREAGDFGEHPGLNATDWNNMTAALTADMRRAAYQHGAGKEFDQAEERFKIIAEHNRQLGKVLRGPGETAISKLTNAAQEESGNARMLQGLRHSMPAEQFQRIGGTILHELGGAEFSLANFVRGWNKLSLAAKQALFSPQHLKNIDDIVNMGQQTKQALATASKSHTPQVIILWEMARDAVELGVGIGAGVVNPAYGAAAAVGFGAGHVLTRWLSNPSQAAAMRAWAAGYQAVQQRATPVRRATFNFASRRLAHELDIPVDRIMAASGISADASERNAP
jgi:hypothetical protein